MKSVHEIERKFLVTKMPDGLTSYPRTEITQGYLAAEKAGTQVRLRKEDERCVLTAKRGGGLVREEREIELSAEQFAALWPGTEGRRLTKIRYAIPWREFTIELDLYTGRHEGLVVAEVEFPDVATCRAFVPPDWFGADVSGDARYSNVVLAQE